MSRAEDLSASTSVINLDRRKVTSSFARGDELMPIGLRTLVVQRQSLNLRKNDGHWLCRTNESVTEAVASVSVTNVSWRVLEYDASTSADTGSRLSRRMRPVSSKDLPASEKLGKGGKRGIGASSDAVYNTG